jgi:hypothetical protein
MKPPHPSITSDSGTNASGTCVSFCALFMLIVVFVPPLCCAAVAIHRIGIFVNGVCDLEGPAMWFSTIQIGFKLDSNCFRDGRGNPRRLRLHFYLVSPSSTNIIFVCYVTRRNFRPPGLSPVVSVEDRSVIPASTMLSLFL